MVNIYFPKTLLMLARTPPTSFTNLPKIKEVIFESSVFVFEITFLYTL